MANRPSHFLCFFSSEGLSECVFGAVDPLNLDFGLVVMKVSRTVLYYCSDCRLLCVTHRSSHFFLLY